MGVSGNPPPSELFHNLQVVETTFRSLTVSTHELHDIGIPNFFSKSIFVILDAATYIAEKSRGGRKERKKSPSGADPLRLLLFISQGEGS